jgi:hypothetical protein
MLSSLRGFQDSKLKPHDPICREGGGGGSFTAQEPVGRMQDEIRLACLNWIPDFAGMTMPIPAANEINNPAARLSLQ